MSITEKIEDAFNQAASEIAAKQQATLDKLVVGLVPNEPGPEFFAGLDEHAKRWTPAIDPTPRHR